MKTKQHVALIGSAGTGTAFAAACALRRIWCHEVFIVAMDINPRQLVTTSLIADAYHQVPLSAAPEFTDALLEIVAKYSVDTYLPLFPEEIELAARLRACGRLGPEVHVLAPPEHASTACADKLLLARLLAERGIPVPRTSGAHEPFRSDFYFLKLRRGTGGHGARTITYTELLLLPEKSRGKWIVQEICTGPEVTVDVFFDPQSGFKRILCRERLEVKAGVSTKCRLFEDSELEQYALGIAQGLELAGSFCFQVMTSSSRRVVTDVNPRPGAATAMCQVTGNDFHAANFARAWNLQVCDFFRPLTQPCFVTRQYSDFFMGSAT